jgi:hypothetical protein
MRGIDESTEVWTLRARFESLRSIAADLFDEEDKCKLFAAKVWPLLARHRGELAECYEPGERATWHRTGRVTGVLISGYRMRLRLE